MNKIALLLSGGVDSSVALHMLCQTGEKPDCFYIHIVAPHMYKSNGKVCFLLLSKTDFSL